MNLGNLLKPLESFDALDPAGEWLTSKLTKPLSNDAVKSLLSGTWLGHPLHPVLTDLPIGFFTAATLLDVAGGADGAGAADALTVLGLLSVAPTAVAGLSDWSDTVGAEKRLGMVHALANVGGSALYVGALANRRAGSRGLATLFSVAGLAVLNASAFIGGHLVYVAGVSVQHNAFDRPPRGWVRVGSEAELGDGTPHLVSAKGYGVLVLRRGRRFLAITDRCSHAGGPLHEGQVDEESCVTCPWHGSRFRLEDGSVVRGPATVDQPAFDVRVREGDVEVRVRRS